MDKTHSDDCAAVLANRRRLLDGRDRVVLHGIRSVRKDGAITWIKLHESLVRDGSGRADLLHCPGRGHYGAASNPKPRYRKAKSGFGSMADAAPVMIWVSGPDKLCTFFNQGWLDFTGSTLEEALGNGWSTKVHPDDRE